MESKQEIIRALTVIPGIGKSMAKDLWNIGIRSVADLVGREPLELYELSNRFEEATQDRCVLYVFRCAVYFAETPAAERKPDKLLWWNWKD